MEQISVPSSYYAAPWGMLLRVMTLVGIIILLGLPLLTLKFGQIPPGGARLLFYFIPFILVIAFFFTVRGYELADQQLTILRPWWSKSIPLTNLKSAEFLPNAMRGSIRTFGNGGLFAFVGRYRNQKIGPYRAYATDLNRTVVLRFTDKTIIITPDEPEKFVQDISPFALSAGQKI